MMSKPTCQEVYMAACLSCRCRLSVGHEGRHLNYHGDYFRVGAATADAQALQGESAALCEALTRGGEFHNHRVAYDLESEQWELLVDNRQGDKGHPMLTTYYEDVADLLCAIALKSVSQEAR